MNIKERIAAGLAGKYKGLDIKLPGISKYIFGIQRSTYYLVGGISGSGKTTLVDFMLLSAIDDAIKQNIPIHVIYYSFEIDKLTKDCNWLSNIAFNKFNVIISPEKIKGLGDNRLTSEEQGLIDKCIPILDNLKKYIHFEYQPTNPTGINHQIFDHCESIGKIHYEDYIDNSNIKKKKIVGYTPNNPDQYILVVTDNLENLKTENNMNNKENIDKFSEYMVLSRNLFGITPIVVSQFNDGLSSVDRAKFKGVDLSPQITDFKSTRQPYADCEVAIGLMCPWKLDMNRCLGYDLNSYKESFIMCKIIKNRLSKDNIATGLIFNPQAGTFKEI